MALIPIDKDVWILGRTEKEKDKNKRRIRTEEKEEEMGEIEREAVRPKIYFFVTIHHHAIVFLRLQGYSAGTAFVT